MMAIPLLIQLFLVNQIMVINHTLLNSTQKIRFIFMDKQKRLEGFIYNANYYVLDGGQFTTAFSQDLSTITKSTVFGTGRGTQTSRLQLFW